MKYYILFFLMVNKLLMSSQVDPVTRNYYSTDGQFIDHSFEANQYELKVVESCIKSQQHSSKPIIKIPVLFHNLLKSGEVTSTEHSRIVQQFAVINTAFSGDFDSKNQDSRIRFCLSTQNSGIKDTIVSDTLSITGLMSLSQTLVSRSETKKCIHIFVLDFNNATAGYVPYMDTLIGNDCIFLNRKFLSGNNTLHYSTGKTLIHLLGNYLGLRPLWGNGHCEDDGISDTPKHHGTNIKCFAGKRMSSCAPGTYQLSDNFMDALPDA
jgi:hypothetical protein